MAEQRYEHVSLHLLNTKITNMRTSEVETRQAQHMSTVLSLCLHVPSQKPSNSPRYTTITSVFPASCSGSPDVSELLHSVPRPHWQSNGWATHSVMHATPVHVHLAVTETLTIPPTCLHFVTQLRATEFQVKPCNNVSELRINFRLVLRSSERCAMRNTAA